MAKTYKKKKRKPTNEQIDKLNADFRIAFSQAVANAVVVSALKIGETAHE